MVAADEASLFTALQALGTIEPTLLTDQASALPRFGREFGSLHKKIYGMSKKSSIAPIDSHGLLLGYPHLQGESSWMGRSVALPARGLRWRICIRAGRFCHGVCGVRRVAAHPDANPDN